MRIYNILAVLLVIILAGCATSKSASTSAFHRDCEGLLWALNDSGTQESVIKIAGQFDQVMESHGRNQLVNTLQSIAQDNAHLRPWAIKMLARYTSAEDHSDFRISLKRERTR